MKLKKIEEQEKNNVKKRGRGWSSKYRPIVNDFLSSGDDCAEITEFTTSATSCATSLSTYLKQHNINGVKAISRKGKVFIVKEEFLEKE